MKKKLIALVVCLAMLAIALIGGTMAYFTDDKAQTNVFTAGKVEITLDEAAVKMDEAGNLVKDTSKDRIIATASDATPVIHDYGKIYPGQTIYKDPTIKVASGSEKAYVAAKVIVTDCEGDLKQLIGGHYLDMLDISLILSGGYARPNQNFRTDHVLHGRNQLPVYGDSTYAVYQQKEGEAYVFYFFVENAMDENSDPVVLFDTLTINKNWDNEEMAHLKELSIQVKAFATQQHGFKNCYEAMTASFKDEFKFN